MLGLFNMQREIKMREEADPKQDTIFLLCQMDGPYECPIKAFYNKEDALKEKRLNAIKIRNYALSRHGYPENSPFKDPSLIILNVIPRRLVDPDCFKSIDDWSEYSILELDIS